jgi:hypothetical protein
MHRVTDQVGLIVYSREGKGVVRGEVAGKFFYPLKYTLLNMGKPLAHIKE